MQEPLPLHYKHRWLQWGNEWQTWTNELHDIVLSDTLILPIILWWLYQSGTIPTSVWRHLHYVSSFLSFSWYLLLRIPLDFTPTLFLICIAGTLSKLYFWISATCCHPLPPRLASSLISSGQNVRLHMAYIVQQFFIANQIVLQLWSTLLSPIKYIWSMILND